MKKILIVNVNWLGDTIFVTPFIRALRDNYPDSYITVFTHPRCVDILKDNPNINDIILYDEKGEQHSIVKKFSVIAKLKSERFDTAFILRKSLSRTMLLSLSKIPERIGYDSKKAGWLLTKRIPVPSEDLHKVEYFLNLARSVGIRPKSCKYEFFVPAKDEIKRDQILRGEGLKDKEDFIVINAGGNWDLKRWPVENFAALADEVTREFHIKVVFTGAQKDIQLCEDIQALMKCSSISVCGKTDLKTLGAVFKRASFLSLPR